MLSAGDRLPRLCFSGSVKNTSGLIEVPGAHFKVSRPGGVPHRRGSASNTLSVWWLLQELSLKKKKKKPPKSFGDTFYDPNSLLKILHLNQVPLKSLSTETTFPFRVVLLKENSLVPSSCLAFSVTSWALQLPCFQSGVTLALFLKIINFSALEGCSHLEPWATLCRF